MWQEFHAGRPSENSSEKVCCCQNSSFLIGWSSTPVSFLPEVDILEDVEKIKPLFKLCCCWRQELCKSGNFIHPFQRAFNRPTQSRMWKAYLRLYFHFEPRSKACRFNRSSADFHSSEVSSNHDCSLKRRGLFLGHQVHGFLPCAGKPRQGVQILHHYWLNLHLLLGYQGGQGDLASKD